MDGELDGHLQTLIPPSDRSRQISLALLHLSHRLAYDFYLLFYKCNYPYITCASILKIQQAILKSSNLESCNCTNIFIKWCEQIHWRDSTAWEFPQSRGLSVPSRALFNFTCLFCTIPNLQFPAFCAPCYWGVDILVCCILEKSVNGKPHTLEYDVKLFFPSLDRVLDPRFKITYTQRFEGEISPSPGIQGYWWEFRLTLLSLPVNFLFTQEAFNVSSFSLKFWVSSGCGIFFFLMHVTFLWGSIQTRHLIPLSQGNYFLIGYWNVDLVLTSFSASRSTVK